MPFEDPDGNTKGACEEKLNEFAPALGAPDFLDTNLPMDFECTARGDPEHCMRAVKQGPARGGDDFVVLGGEVKQMPSYGVNMFGCVLQETSRTVPLRSLYFKVGAKGVSKSLRGSSSLFRALAYMERALVVHCC